MRDKVYQTHIAILNPNSNGGEAVYVTTHFVGNGDPITDKEGIYLQQEINLESYSNEACIRLFGAYFTPEFLRNWANELEQVRNKLVK